MKQCYKTKFSHLFEKLTPELFVDGLAILLAVISSFPELFRCFIGEKEDFFPPGSNVTAVCNPSKLDLNFDDFVVLLEVFEDFFPLFSLFSTLFFIDPESFESEDIFFGACLREDFFDPQHAIEMIGVTSKTIRQRK